jgi:hypothetical protein
MGSGSLVAKAEPELELILGHRADIDADVLVLLSILEVDDIGDDGEGRPVADPAVIGVQSADAVEPEEQDPR